MRISIVTALLSTALVASTGCQYSTSANPLQPSTVVPHAQPAPGAAATVSLTPEELIAQVSARYPERLAGGVSADERVANMEFLRDRIIEDGRCGGVKLAWNLKRGVGPRSIDAIAWRRGEDNILEVVDIAQAYDDPGSPLQLHWIIVDGPAGWDPGEETACPGA